jgi:hypothetical protein
VGSCGHVLSCQAINVVVSRDPDAASAYPVLKDPRWDDWMPRPVSGRGGRQNGQTSGEILPAHDYRK